jgi:hypothetical protein
MRLMKRMTNDSRTEDQGMERMIRRKERLEQVVKSGAFSSFAQKRRIIKELKALYERTGILRTLGTR